MNKEYLFWLMSAYAKKLGIWGLLGLLLLIGSIIFYCTKIPEVKARIEAEKVAQLDATKKRDIAQVKEVRPTQNAEEDVAEFYSRFPTVEGIPKVLAKLNQIAKKQNIKLTVGQYKYKPVKRKKAQAHQRLTKYEIVLPVEGQYTKIRRFISESLGALPAMALVDLQVVREDTQGAKVDARLVFVVFVKDNT